MNSLDQDMAEPPPPPANNDPQHGTSGNRSTGGIRSSSATWTSVNNPANNGPTGDAELDDAMNGTEAALLEDLNNARHVDTSSDNAYHDNATHYTGHYILPSEGQQAMQAMRDYLKILLPQDLVKDEFGTAIAMEAVSSQHLAKLQGKVWRELPKMVATAATGVDGSTTKECIIAAQSVYYIARALSEINSVFILHPRSMQSCHSALCQHFHEKLEQPYSEYEVTLEPLVDWMTLDPVIDIKPLWFTLFRRNKALLHKFALTNSKFIPRKPVKFCLECLTMIAGERNVAWYILTQQPDILYADVPLPWPAPEGPDPGGNTIEANLSSDSDSSTSTELARSSVTMIEHGSMIPYVDGAFDFTAKPRSRKLEIWRDPTPRQQQEGSSPALQLPLRVFDQTYPSTPQERQPMNHTGWTSINQPCVLTTPSSNESIQSLVDQHSASSTTQYNMSPPAEVPLKGTFDMSEGEKYPAARAGFPNGPAQEYQHKPEISFEAAPMEDCGPIFSEHPTKDSASDSVYESEIDTESSTDGGVYVYDGNERRFGDELDRNRNMIGRVQGNPFSLWPLVDPETTESDLEAADPDLETIESNTETTEPDPETTGPDLEATVSQTEVEAPVPQTPHNAFRHGDYTWPAWKDSKLPVPARPAPGSDITPKDMYPLPNHLICSCEQPAKTGDVLIVQCRNTECLVRWYHYECLKDASEKGTARFGTLLCGVCKGEKYWGKAEGVTDLSMPFTREEILCEIMDEFGAGGVGDPYGLGKNQKEEHPSEVEDTEKFW